VLSLLLFLLAALSKNFWTSFCEILTWSRHRNKKESVKF